MNCTPVLSTGGYQCHTFDMDLKPSRLFQPRNPLFWVMLILNVLSAVLAWMLRSDSLTSFAMFAIGLFALGNAVLGIMIALRLMRDESKSDGE